MPQDGNCSLDEQPTDDLLAALHERPTRPGDVWFVPPGTPHAIGAGVFITPNSVRQLERVGLGPSVERWGSRVGTGSQYFREDGTAIAPVQVSDSSGWNATLLYNRMGNRLTLVGYNSLGFPDVYENPRDVIALPRTWARSA